MCGMYNIREERWIVFLINHWLKYPELGKLPAHSSSGGCHKDTATLVVKIGGEIISPEGGATIKPPYGPGDSTTFRIPACVKQYQKMVGDKAT